MAPFENGLKNGPTSATCQSDSLNDSPTFGNDECINRSPATAAVLAFGPERAALAPAFPRIGKGPWRGTPQDGAKPVPGPVGWTSRTDFAHANARRDAMTKDRRPLIGINAD